MLLFIGYMELMKLWMPPQPDPQDPAVQEQVVDETADAAPADPDVAIAEANPETVDPELDDQDLDDQEQARAEQAWYTVGSLDPTSGYKMLVTLNSRGGAVERIELNDPHYNDLEDKSAYIGHFACTPGDSGARVNVVGDGTPAAIAGVQVGDEIVSIGETSVTSPSSVQLALQNFRYGDTVPVTVNRDGASVQLTVTSARRPMEVVRPEQNPASEAPWPTAKPGDPQPLSYLISLYQLGHIRADFQDQELGKIPSLRNELWYASTGEKDGEPVVEFRMPISKRQLRDLGLNVNASFEVVKRFWLPKHASGDESQPTPSRDYHLNFDVEFVNQGSEQLEIGYRVDGPTGLPLEGWWYAYKTHPTAWGGAGVRDVVWQSDVEDHKMYTNPSIVDYAKDNPDRPQKLVVESAQKLKYLGVDAQYFNSSLLSREDTEEANQAVVFEKVEVFPLSGEDEQKSTKTPVTFRADSSTLILPPNASNVQQFEIFAGPKHPDVLAQYGLEQCIVYGWFKFFAKVMASLLHVLHGIVGNYGISIILLTMLVRGCMFPIGRQQAKSAKMMQELAPEIKKIKEKYPNDTEKQTKAQQELFRKHNYNPLVGCLPMFIQLPIFIGLYRALSVDIELRQTPLIQGLEWCSNLAAPDMMFQWNHLIPFEALTGYTGFLGPYFNLLPVISTCLFLVHQQLFTPPPADEQQEMQQKVMKFMMIFMLVLFFRVPAGLCIYFITSSLWALGERLMLPKDDKTKTTAVVESSEDTEKAARPSAFAEAREKLLNRDKPPKETAAERKKRRKKSRK